MATICEKDFTHYCYSPPAFGASGICETRERILASKIPIKTKKDGYVVTIKVIIGIAIIIKVIIIFSVAPACLSGPLLSWPGSSPTPLWTNPNSFHFSENILFMKNHHLSDGCRNMVLLQGLSNWGSSQFSLNHPKDTPQFFFLQNNQKQKFSNIPVIFLRAYLILLRLIPKPMASILIILTMTKVCPFLPKGVPLCQANEKIPTSKQGSSPPAPASLPSICSPLSNIALMKDFQKVFNIIVDENSGIFWKPSFADIQRTASATLVLNLNAGCDGAAQSRVARH